jgi:hypothetical protein
MVLHMRAEHAPLNPASICVHAADHLARRTQTWRHPANEARPGWAPGRMTRIRRMTRMAPGRLTQIRRMTRMGARAADSDQEDDSDGHPGG